MQATTSLGHSYLFDDDQFIRDQAEDTDMEHPEAGDDASAVDAMLQDGPDDGDDVSGTVYYCLI